jgi:hypothetical protein
MDFVKINGTAVRITGVSQRAIPQEDGPPRQEVELVVILRGAMAHRSFQSLLGRGAIRLDIPEDDGAGWTTLDTEIAAAYHSASGSGEAAAYRHDVTLRETPDSARRRTAERSTDQADQPEPARTTSGEPRQAEPAVEDDPLAPDDLSGVTVAASADVWATALRKMTAPDPSKPPPPELPLETAQLAGAEAVLVGLRLEALIEQLVAAGIVRHAGVDASFARLVRERFVNEATPVIGQEAAERAARSAQED